MRLLPHRYIWIGLNVVRLLSITACVLVLASNVVTLKDDVGAVKEFNAAKTKATAVSSSANRTMADVGYIPGSTIPNQPMGEGWVVVNGIFMIALVLILILSEIGYHAKAFDRFFPVLGEGFGLFPLGIIQILVAGAVLSHHADGLTLVSGFFLFSIGWLNVFLNVLFFFFSDGSIKSQRSCASWTEKIQNTLPMPVQQGLGPAELVPSPQIRSNGKDVDEKRVGDSVSSTCSSNSPGLQRNSSGMGFGRQGEQMAAMNGYLIARPLESHGVGPDGYIWQQPLWPGCGS